MQRQAPPVIRYTFSKGREAKCFGFGSVVRALHQQFGGWVLFLLVTAGPWH